MEGSGKEWSPQVPSKGVTDIVIEFDDFPGGLRLQRVPTLGPKVIPLFKRGEP